jgi:NAD(P)-dependent dehydrogenase (short-subunit alcohol dehydrogenase family)
LKERIMTDKRNATIALITGGNRGLGRNTALHLARKGVDILLTYHTNKSEAETVVAEIHALGRNALAFQLDTGTVAGFDAFTERVQTALAAIWDRKTFDFLINNAGIGVHASFAETTEADFDRLMNIHLKGVFFLTQKLLPMIADGGRIVNLSTGLARFSLPGYAAYASMKGAIEVLTRYLAQELGNRRIAVNSIAPGAIETDFAGGAVRDNAALNKQVASQTAMRRAGLPDDIGGAISSLLLGETGWMTGQRIEVSGGMHL